MNAAAGLCADCRFARSIVTSRGGFFTLCARAETDPRFERYPRLPVRACPGHEPALVESDDPSEES